MRQAPVERSIPEPRLPDAEIALVGHDAPALRDADERLRRAGLRVLHVAAGARALEELRRKLPDVIGVDDTLGEADGFEVCASIKADPELSSTPVLLMTRLGRSALLSRCLSARVDDVIGKPLDLDELCVRMRALIRLGRVQRLAIATARLDGGVTQAAIARVAPPEATSPPASDAEHGRAGPFEAMPQARCKAVVMFADLRGFTAMSERLDPPTVMRALNEFFPMLVSVTRRHRGAVFGMAGDNLMTGFGVPIEEPDAPLRAVRSACEMLTEFDSLSDRWSDHYGIRVGLGVGIELGDVVAGYVGTHGLESYTLVGDAVNTASRLTGRARAGEFLASAPVFDAARAMGFDHDARRLPPLELKGKSEPFDAWAVTVGSRKPWTSRSPC